MSIVLNDRNLYDCKHSYSCLLLHLSFSLSVGLKLIGGVFPVIIIVFAVGMVLAVIVAFTSSNDKPPIYHCVRREREREREEEG